MADDKALEQTGTDGPASTFDPDSYERKTPKKRPRPKNAAPPFTSETAREMQRRSAEARVQKKRIADAEIAAMRELVGQKLIDLPPKEKLQELAGVVLVDTLLRLAAGNITAKTPNEAVAVAKACFEISRVLEGMPTTITWSEKQAQERYQELHALVEKARATGGGLAAVPDPVK